MSSNLSKWTQGCEGKSLGTSLKTVTLVRGEMKAILQVGRLAFVVFFEKGLLGLTAGYCYEVLAECFWFLTSNL